MRIKFLTINILTCLIIHCGQAFCQADYSIVIISPRVGEIIDKTEKEYYHLFQSLDGFEQAFFFMDASNNFYANVSLTKNEAIIDTVILYNEAYLIRTSELIDNFESVAAGGYEFKRTKSEFTTIKDTSNLITQIYMPSLTASDSQNVVTKTKKATTYKTDDYKNYGRLNLSEDKIDLTLDYYPKLGVGLGSSTPLSANEINNVLLSIEDRFRNAGYSVKHNEFEITTSVYLWFILKLQITENASLALNAGYTPGESEPDFTSVTIYASYRADIFNLGWLKPYCSIGFSSNTISLDQSFSYNDRISPIDTSGGYDYLSSIIISGEGDSFGYNFLLGLELGTSSAGLNLYTEYIFINPYKFKAGNQSDAFEIDLSGFCFGASIIMYF